MEGVPGLVCPECGKDAKRERRLLKTRRRWGWAVVTSALLLTIATSVHRTPDVRARGWPAAVPSVFLLGGMHWLDAPHWQERRTALSEGTPLPPRKRMYEELVSHRLMVDELWGWQQRWLIERCIAGDSKRPPLSDAWQQQYIAILRKLRDANEYAEILDRDPDSFGARPSVRALSLRPRELERVWQGLVLASIRTRPRWPVGVPLTVDFSPRDFSVRRPHWREFTMQTRLPGSSPSTWTMSRNATLIPSTAASGGYALEPQSLVTFHVLLKEVLWDEETGSSAAHVLLDTTIDYPITIAGTAEELLTPVQSDALSDAIERALAPVCLPDPAAGSAIHLSLAYLRGFDRRALTAALARHPKLTAGFRIELLRNGAPVADGSGWFTTTLTERGPFLNGDFGMLTLEPRGGVQLEPRDSDEWRLRLIGDAAVALRDFDCSEYWRGTIEVPVEWKQWGSERR
jgi:hypothetical protein